MKTLLVLLVLTFFTGCQSYQAYRINKAMDITLESLIRSAEKL